MGADLAGALGILGSLLAIIGVYGVVSYQASVDYNRRFARPPREKQIAWRAVPENLERICCFIHERIVSNDNVAQWDGRRFSFAGAKVQIILIFGFRWNVQSPTEVFLAQPFEDRAFCGRAMNPVIAFYK